MVAIEKLSQRARKAGATANQGHLPFGERAVSAADRSAADRSAADRPAADRSAAGRSAADRPDPPRRRGAATGGRPAPLIRIRAMAPAVPTATVSQQRVPTRPARRTIVLADLPALGQATLPPGISTEPLPRRASVVLDALGAAFVFAMFFAAAAMV